MIPLSTHHQLHIYTYTASMKSSRRNQSEPRQQRTSTTPNSNNCPPSSSSSSLPLKVLFAPSYIPPSPDHYHQCLPSLPLHHNHNNINNNKTTPQHHYPPAHGQLHPQRRHRAWQQCPSQAISLQQGAQQAARRTQKKEKFTKDGHFYTGAIGIGTYSWGDRRDGFFYGDVSISISQSWDGAKGPRHNIHNIHTSTTHLLTFTHTHTHTILFFLKSTHPTPWNVPN